MSVRGLVQRNRLVHLWEKQVAEEARQVRFDIGETYERYREPTTKHE